MLFCDDLSEWGCWAYYSHIFEVLNGPPGCLQDSFIGILRLFLANFLEMCRDGLLLSAQFVGIISVNYDCNQWPQQLN